MVIYGTISQLYDKFLQHFLNPQQDGPELYVGEGLFGFSLVSEILKGFGETLILIKYNVRWSNACYVCILIAPSYYSAFNVNT